jgi:hypothetical protein
MKACERGNPGPEYNNTVSGRGLADPCNGPCPRRARKRARNQDIQETTAVGGNTPPHGSPHRVRVTVQSTIRLVNLGRGALPCRFLPIFRLHNLPKLPATLPHTAKTNKNRSPNPADRRRAQGGERGSLTAKRKKEKIYRCVQGD